LIRTEAGATRDLSIDGVVRKVLMQANKNGFFYVLDRQTGKLISAQNSTPLSSRKAQAAGFSSMHKCEPSRGAGPPTK
jgi:glucose dehydrogenase